MKEIFTMNAEITMSYDEQTDTVMTIDEYKAQLKGWLEETLMNHVAHMDDVHIDNIKVFRVEENHA